MTPDFSVHPLPTRIEFGEHAMSRVGDSLRSLESDSVLVVTDPGVKAAGHLDRLLELAKPWVANVAVYDTVHENPTTADIEACRLIAAKQGIDTIIALGGGSAIDTAKGCNFVLTNGGGIDQYAGWGRANQPMLPLIAIPTTAGTGSECQSYAVIADAHTHRKMACGDRKAAPAIAILDPVLTLTQPAFVTACTGFDVIVHTVESFVTLKRNPVSLLYAKEALSLAYRAYPQVLAFPGELGPRGEMMLAAAFAGTAIEHSMLGAAHAAANPLTAHYGIAHGQAVGIMLPKVMRFNAEVDHVLDWYAELAIICGIGTRSDSVNALVYPLIECLEAMLDKAALLGPLCEFGVDSSAIEQLADEASQQWTGKFNPRPVSTKDFAGLYQAALVG